MTFRSIRLPRDGSLMKTTDVADALSISVQTVRNLVRSGKIRCSKCGRIWRYRPEDVREFITVGMVDGNEESD